MVNLRRKTKNTSRGASEPARKVRSERDAFLKEQGLYAAETVGDGNCLFYALSEQLFGTPDQHLEVRQKVCDHLQANADSLWFFAPEEATSSDDPMQGFLDHVERMRQPGKWGEEVEILAFAEAYGVSVKCWSRPAAGRKGNPRFEEYGDANAARKCFVCFDRQRNHYETLRNLDGPHEGLPDCFHLAAAQKKDEGLARGADEEASSVKSCGSKRSSSERGDDDKDGSDKDEPAGKRSKLSPSPAPAPGQAVKESADKKTATTAEATAQSSTASSSAVEKSAAAPAATSVAPTAPAASDEKAVATTTAAAEVGRPSRSSSSSSSKRSFSQRGDDGTEGDVEEKPAKSPKLDAAAATKDSGSSAPAKKAVPVLIEDSEGDSDVVLGSRERSQIARAQKARIEGRSEAAKARKTAGLKKAVGAKAKTAAVGQSKEKAGTAGASIAAAAKAVRPAAHPETKSRNVARSDHKVKVSEKKGRARVSKPPPASKPGVGKPGVPKTWEERREADRLAKEHVKALQAKRERKRREEEEERKKKAAEDKGRKDAGAGKAAGLSKEKTTPKPRRRK